MFIVFPSWENGDLCIKSATIPTLFIWYVSEHPQIKAESQHFNSSPLFHFESSTLEFRANTTNTVLVSQYFSNSLNYNSSVNISNRTELPRCVFSAHEHFISLDSPAFSSVNRHRALSSRDLFFIWLEINKIHQAAQWQWFYSSCYTLTHLLNLISRLSSLTAWLRL